MKICWSNIHICTFEKSKWEFKFTETRMQICDFGKLVNGINVDKLFYQLALLLLFVVQLATAGKKPKKISDKFTSTLEWGNSFFACFIFFFFTFYSFSLFCCDFQSKAQTNKIQLLFVNRIWTVLVWLNVIAEKKTHYGKNHGWFGSTILHEFEPMNIQWARKLAHSRVCVETTEKKTSTIRSIYSWWKADAIFGIYMNV